MTNKYGVASFFSVDRSKSGRLHVVVDIEIQDTEEGRLFAEKQMNLLIVRLWESMPDPLPKVEK